MSNVSTVRRIRRQDREVSEERLAQAARQAELGWTEPMFTAPVPISEVELVELGEVNGRTWYRHDAFGELSREVREWRDTDTLPNGPIMQTVDEAGDRVFVSYIVHRPGTYARITAPAAAIAPRPPRPARPVDLLDGIGIFTRTANTALGHHAPLRVRGAAAIVARLASKGVAIELSADGSTLVPRAPGGRSIESAAAMAAAPLLIAYLRDGVPPACAVTIHPEPVEAVTVALAYPGGVPWCGECGRAAAKEGAA